MSFFFFSICHCWRKERLERGREGGRRTGEKKEEKERNKKRQKEEENLRHFVFFYLKKKCFSWFSLLERVGRGNELLMKSKTTAPPRKVTKTGNWCFIDVFLHFCTVFFLWLGGAAENDHLVTSLGFQLQIHYVLTSYQQLHENKILLSILPLLMVHMHRGGFSSDRHPTLTTGWASSRGW